MAIAQSIVEGENRRLRADITQFPDGVWGNPDVATDTDLPRGPLAHQFKIPLAGHARLASANSAGVGEGAGTVALQDGADRDSDGLALRGNL